VAPVRDRRRQLAGISAAALILLAAVPTIAQAQTGLAGAVSTVSSPFQKPFLAPRPRPTETRWRPTDKPDPGHSEYTVPEAPRSPDCAAHFCVHWVAKSLDQPSLKDADANGIPDYVEKVLAVAEHVHTVENEELGWKEPVSDGGLGGGRGLTDIYLTEIGGSIFGYTSPDTKQASPENPVPRHLHAYMVLDNDYSPFEFPGTSATNDLEVTIAHEYNHVLQFGYDAFQDPWFAESTAVWMEDQVYGEVNDYVHYLSKWVRRYDTPLTANTIKEYGSAVWNDWLSRRYGPGFVRQAWAGAIDTKPGGFAVSAYDAAIKADGHSDFGHDFTSFAADVAEWRTGEGFTESGTYPDVPRRGHLALGRPPLRRALDHTTFQLIEVPAQGGDEVTVQATAPTGVAAGLVLVGRVGGEKQGTTVKDVDYSAGGGKLRVKLDDPGQFKRLTAVVVNADTRSDFFSGQKLDWSYLAEGAQFEISGRIVR
jgi:hypothetical protein